MALRLTWSDDQEERPIDPELIRLLERLLAIAGKRLGLEHGEVSLTFVGDEEIRELNRQFRNVDKVTDVLSFPLFEDGADDIRYDELDVVAMDEVELDEVETDAVELDEVETAGAHADDMETAGETELDVPLGDVVICVPQALRQSGEYGHAPEREIGFLFVHGLLHLLGYDHETAEDEREMFALQEEILQEAGLAR